MIIKWHQNKSRKWWFYGSMNPLSFRGLWLVYPKIKLQFQSVLFWIRNLSAWVSRAKVLFKWFIFAEISKYIQVFEVGFTHGMDPGSVGPTFWTSFSQMPYFHERRSQTSQNMVASKSFSWELSTTLLQHSFEFLNFEYVSTSPFIFINVGIRVPKAWCCQDA